MKIYHTKFQYQTSEELKIHSNGQPRVNWAINDIASIVSAINKSSVMSDNNENLLHQLFNNTEVWKTLWCENKREMKTMVFLMKIYYSSEMNRSKVVKMEQKNVQLMKSLINYQNDKHFKRSLNCGLILDGH